MVLNDLPSAHSCKDARSTLIACTDNLQTIFQDFCIAFVCVSEILREKSVF
jgi:hypothetical protein